MDDLAGKEPSTLHDQLLKPFRDFLRLESASGILLLCCASLALLWANSPWGTSYVGIWEQRVTVAAGETFSISKPLLLWINDGLMAVFFLVVGLEIKRELECGELASPRRAALPLAAALGGMLMPVACFAAWNVGQPAMRGWAIPMATDIAFALGILALLGSRAPVALKIFLTAVAIVDDLGAVLVIAICYTAELQATALLYSLGTALAAWLYGRAGGRSTVVFGVLGLVMWVLMLKSGVHATIAGVLLAMVLPSRSLPQESEPLTQRWEHALHPWTAFLIMPIFALANAGVGIGRGFLEMLSTPAAAGVITGLLIGKPLGILLFTRLAVLFRLATLPVGLSWRQIAGAGCLAGVGFTMALFVADLAFGLGDALTLAKAAILAASLAAGIVGYVLILTAPVQEETADSESLR